MNKEFPRKIHIIGSVGSGKTTLAKELSEKLNIRYYELDNVVWIRQKSGDIRRTDQQKVDYLQNIILTKAWIIEGVHNEEWVEQSFLNADLIIFINTNYYIRIYRIIKRFTLQKLGLEKSNYKPTFSIFIKMFQWNRYFEEISKPNFYNKYGKYKDKLLVVTSKREILKKSISNK
ncbi:DNA topology modulation protein FlaR [Lysinibacillus sp. KCTC 33748]|uniref:AAA family ATPase n=1 Tax=unclassified Lysinibacillus TaxID=2636778 RepID=UPI0009A82EA1|nr:MULTISPECIES: AAA family ATPase [unclassified Lysinibacillus]OXS68521.1 DNA topology modulation protein FlaR [Lysinibacillus sp. KCTC 33748]SKC10478.1 Adenylate kinase [Lysinibacillus sp. AC-3]